ncbi:hypothetical protein DXG03_005487 [Asterophora parasitica]|uniref:Uncharacterized protein n=1 Tax=Asterophora parasitica TaxID=117018 RepID=A0A9P7G1W6_9AGAR|nr:hypothetical protein DXG03_005487 [Asterophora parasitica]
MQPDIAALHRPAAERLIFTDISEPAPVEHNEPVESDYPRPVQHRHEQGQAPPPPYHEEERPPKKEKKHTSHENEKHMRDRKIDSTRPSKDIMNGNKGFGAAGRIAQPAEKFGL